MRKCPDTVEPVDVSATAFVTFQQCPERANARFRGEYGPPSRASFLGGLAHRPFARHLTGGPIPPGELEAVCREEIGSHPNLNFKLGESGMKPSTLADVVREAGVLEGGRGAGTASRAVVPVLSAPQRLPRGESRHSRARVTDGNRTFAGM